VCSLRPSPVSNANSVTFPPPFFASTRLAMPCSVGAIKSDKRNASADSIVPGFDIINLL
jgi:hypothetical protein